MLARLVLSYVDVLVYLSLECHTTEISNLQVWKHVWIWFCFSLGFSIHTTV